MSLKMKLAAAAMAVGSTAVNAQSYDVDKERKENPAGYPALVCAATGSYIAADLKPNDPKIVPIAIMVNNATKIGDVAYKSHDTFIWKTVSLMSFYRDGMETLKVTNFSDYANMQAQLHSTLNDCKKRYTPDLAPQVK